MEKTVVMRLIEEITQRMDCYNEHGETDRTQGRADELEEVLLILNRMLPVERQQIEAAFKAAREMRTPTAKKHGTATDYYNQTYLKTEEHG